ncbi:uncharacterized protein LOC124929368 [Impatiens glandulifera]|uniref:uncharacterized protein LOC124929368 n=1 Tax=Impatiens glandulifera TaxID=253017 RepID=UPI001FB09775|nr:uncharacterized protein LOC124929368 [Impatiens glandulifera]
MANSEREWTDDDREVNLEENNLDDFTTDASSSNSGSSRFRLTERLADILVQEGDGDLLLQRNDQEDGVFQFLRALDLQVMGACRADERLKPLLKLHVSGGGSEDRLLSHLSQHFEPSEIGMLARCLCIPLVSIRVGKINKQGALMCPTGTRGNLDLTFVPTTSDLRISFVGDDGQTERLTTIKRACPSASVERISADKSGRSFLIKTPEGEVFYFWWSEKSKLVGDELLKKMENLIEEKPSLAELTGICESRLNQFASHLRAYFVGSIAFNANNPPKTVPLAAALTNSPRFRNQAGGGKHSTTGCSSIHQCSLGPRWNSFKECPPKNLLSSLRNVAKDKLKRKFSSIDDLSPLILDTKCLNIWKEDSNKHQLQQQQAMGLLCFSSEALEKSDTSTSSSSSSSLFVPEQQPLFRLPIMVSSSQKIPSFSPYMDNIDIITSGIAALGLVSLSDRTHGTASDHDESNGEDDSCIRRAGLGEDGS